MAPHWKFPSVLVIGQDDLTRGESVCMSAHTCDGPMCTYLREEADRLISLYQNWKQELLDKQNVSNIEQEMKNL